MSEGRLRLVRGGVALPAGPPPDPAHYQAQCIEAFMASQIARNYSPTSISKGTFALERFLTVCDRLAWEVTPEDVDRALGELAGEGVGPVTRRHYLQAFKSFHAFLVSRRGAEIQALFGVAMANPIDEFNATRHVADGSPAELAPPSVDRLEELFDYLKDRIATARKFGPAGRDYALYRTLAHAGLRADEAASLEIPDLHFARGPFGKIHVRFGKGAKTSGPRPRWVPMLDSLDLILRWYLEDVRPRLGEGTSLFCREGGGRLSAATIRNRLRALHEREGTEPSEWFSPHAMRRACATTLYERGVDLVAIQQMLGHWHIGSTMRYVLPSATFIENAYRSAVSRTLQDLQEVSDGD